MVLKSKIKLFVLIFSLLFLSSCLAKKSGTVGKNYILAKGQASPKEIVNLSYNYDKMALSAEFEIEGEALSIETRRGGRMVSLDPDAPEYDIEMYFINKWGALFMLVQGDNVPEDKELKRRLKEKERTLSQSEYEPASSKIHR